MKIRVVELDGTAREWDLRNGDTLSLDDNDTGTPLMCVRPTKGQVEIEMHSLLASIPTTTMAGLGRRWLRDTLAPGGAK